MSLTDRTSFTLGKLGRLAADRFTERLQPLGLRPPAATLLSVISDRPGASQEELGTILRQAPSGIVAMLDELERLGAVRRLRHRTDRRRHVVTLTPAGRLMLTQVETMARSVDQELLAALQPGDQETLVRLLRDAAVGLGVIEGAGEDRESR